MYTLLPIYFFSPPRVHFDLFSAPEIPNSKAFWDVQDVKWPGMAKQGGCFLALCATVVNKGWVSRARGGGGWGARGGGGLRSEHVARQQTDEPLAWS